MPSKVLQFKEVLLHLQGKAPSLLHNVNPWSAAGSVEIPLESATHNYSNSEMLGASFSKITLS